ncbi:unnamed protein product, partial [Ascophyllum nodosum]
SWDLNAGTRSTETESFRSARVARRRATYAERTERQRLRDAHERRMAGGASPAAVLTNAVTRLAWQQHQANVNAAAEAAALRAMHEESARLAAANAAADEAAR